MKSGSTLNRADSGADFAHREFPMTAEDFRFIQKLARERTGIELGEQKKEMIYSRIVRRLRALDLTTFRDYCQYLQQNTATELTPFINAITTNLTSFFREPHHFDFLAKTALPHIRQRNGNSRRLRIWSAGCSTGEEPYSIAITLQQALGNEQWDALILATDLDTNVLDHGRAGIYGHDRVASMDGALLKKHFLLNRGKNHDDDRYQARDHLKQLIRFNQLNLLEQWPMKGPFDVIFCRNVVIYFSKDTQRTLFDRYADILAPDGYLFIGHSESLHGVTRRFEPVGRTIYRRMG